jgi:ABC-type polysaccharide/polyol phosphate transport system ATPase subunit
MTYIKAHNLGVTFSIYNSKTRSFRNHLLSAVGGNAHSHDGTTYVEALRGIDLDIKQGERVAILGHNGSGKSTLLRVLSGVYEPTSGSIESSGSISSLTDICMGMDPENTGYQNIIMRCIFMGMTVKEAKNKVNEIVDFSELHDYIHLPMRTYSTGMYMRLALTIATSSVPDILIMDEMIGTGDSDFIKKAKQRTLEFIQKTKLMVISSHDISIVRELCNRVIWLEKGKIIADGSVKEVTKDYLAHKKL